MHEGAQECVGVNRNGLEAVCELACTLVKRGVLVSTTEAVTEVEPRALLRYHSARLGDFYDAS